MEMDYLWEFLILAQVKNYQVAAHRLFLSEPTLSRHMKALEDAYNAPLFERGGRGLELTEYGNALIPYASNVVDTMNLSRTSIQFLRAKHDSALRVTSAYPILGMVNVFHQDNPDISVNIIQNRGNTESILENLLAGNLDVAIVRNMPADDRFETIPFTEDYYALIMDRRHPLALRKKLRISELKNERFISFPADQDCNNTLITLCNQAGFEPNIIAVADNGFETALITRYGGVALLMGNTMRDRSILGSFSDNPIAIVDLEPHVDIHVSLVYPKSRSLTPDAQRFVDYLNDVWLPAWNGPQGG